MAKKAITSSITHELEISESEPFNDDVLGSNEYATILTQIIENIDTPVTLGVMSAWGTGKTFFVRRWAQNLKNQGFNAIYYNAWEHDFAPDPLIAFISTVQAYILDAEDESLKKYATKLKKAYEKDFQADRKIRFCTCCT